MCAEKAFAVAILAAVWAGAKLPPEMIAFAKATRAKMKAKGTWLSA